MKTLLITIFAMLIAFSGHSQDEKKLENKNFHDFIVEDIDGNTLDLSNLKGKKVLVVNTASECGYTPQYEGLQNLYEKYGNEDFTVIGFPANNFANQEPGSDEEIKQFCKKNYGVTFPMMSKISVKGEDQHPVYKWLTMAKFNGEMDSNVQWNFQKYLINENGELVDVLYSKTKPNDKKILSWIEGD
ncbi:MAG: glutathione peroxidase [Bacteroidales bacterium]|nr:glutathione peroxidase [Bacteroidales bacterium]